MQGREFVLFSMQPSMDEWLKPSLDPTDPVSCHTHTHTHTNKHTQQCLEWDGTPGVQQNGVVIPSLFHVCCRRREERKEKHD